jgi:serine/threonine protein kinase
LSAQNDPPKPLSSVGRIAELGPELEAFGDYYLIGRFGVGGMAEVFRARRFQEPIAAPAHGAGAPGKRPTRAAPLVVLKRLLSEKHAQDEFADAFVLETDITSMFDHVNVVRTLDSGEIKGRHYLVMELVSGVNLNRLLGSLASNRRHLPFHLAVYVALNALRGLHYTHTFTLPSGRSGHFIHRDLSPHNIFLSFGGSVKLGDFGVLHMDNIEGSSQGAVVTGKLGYLSPEQVNADELDERSDLFSLMIILYECVTGRRLFFTKDGEPESEVMKRIRAAEVPRPSRVIKDLPRAFESVLLKGLNAERDKRYPSAMELIEALDPFLTVSAEACAKELSQLLVRIYPNEHRDFERDQAHGLLPN